MASWKFEKNGNFMLNYDTFLRLHKAKISVLYGKILNFDKVLMGDEFVNIKEA